MPNTPREVTNEVLERGEESILRAFRVAGENVKGRSPYERNLRQDMITKQRIRIRQMLCLIHADYKGGASQAELLGVRDAFGEFIDGLYGSPSLNFNDVNMDEEVAEGPHEVAQTRLMIERSGPAARAFLAANRAYEVANDKLESFARGILTGAHT